MQEPYKAPGGTLDNMESLRHLQHIQTTWDYPIWRHRSGSLQQLLTWSIQRCREESVARGDSASELEEAMHQAVWFVDDVHRALNPEGSQMAIEGQVPPRELDGGKPHFAWKRDVERLWYHAPPEDSFKAWRRDFAAREIMRFPYGCNIEATINVLDDYVKLPHLHHPWIDWMLFDALIRASVIAMANNINMLESEPASPDRQRKGLAKILFGATDRTRQAKADAEATPLRAILTLMLKTYSDLDSGGWTVSPTRIRELMAAAEQAGAGWPPAAYVLIDRAIAKDPAVWNFRSP